MSNSEGSFVSEVVGDVMFTRIVLQFDCNNVTVEWQPTLDILCE